MEMLSYLGIGVLSIFIIIKLVNFVINAGQKTEKAKISKYEYNKKNSIMTKAENTFYKKMQEITGERYYIVPQAHLSMFLNHKVGNQSRRGSFAVINGKSVDFLLCEKETSRPILAVELDDHTHNRSDRVERDKLVEEILHNSDILLVRFRDALNITPAEIFQHIQNTKKLNK
jgi:hypothetical protein